MNKSKIKMQITKRNCKNLTDLRTVIAMSKSGRYKKFPNHQRVKAAVFNSDYSWQERIAWMDRIIDWKGPRGENFKWQCILHNSKEIASEMKRLKSNRVVSDKNPAYNHGGKFSPFSDRFVGKTSKEDAISKMKKTIAENPQNQNTRVEYYLDKGCGLCQAIKKLKKRQAVGSLDNFIKRCGKVEGTRNMGQRVA